GGGHHEPRAGGAARERRRTVAVCRRVAGRHRGVSAPAGGPMKVRGVVALLAVLAKAATAQVDPSGTWRTLHTAHFRIHFRPASRAAAEHEAREAERAYGLLSRELHPPRGVVDLVLGDDI